MANLITARNPARKRKTRRTAAQKAASRRNIRKAQASRRRSPARRRPATRRRSVARRRPARRRNPALPSVKGIISGQVMPALVGGGGAVLNDLLVNFVPLVPANFKTGYLRHVTKAVGAIAIGYIGAMFLPKRTADQLGAGAMTVVGYNVVRDLAAKFAPQLPLGEYLDNNMGEYLDPALGYYGAGMDPTGGGMNIGNQFTRGTPYVDPDGLSAWPTGGDYDDMNY